MTMQMAEGLDTGDILLEARTDVGPNETAANSRTLGAHGGPNWRCEHWPRSGNITPRPQDHSAHTLAPLISRDMAQIDWAQPAAVVHDLVRGFNFGPRPGPRSLASG